MVTLFRTEALLEWFVGIVGAPGFAWQDGAGVLSEF